MTTNDYCLSLAQYLRGCLPYLDDGSTDSVGTVHDRGMTTCRWCSRHFPRVPPEKHRTWMDWMLTRPMSSGMLQCCLCRINGTPSFYCDNDCWQQARLLHSVRVHNGAKLPLCLKWEGKTGTFSEYVFIVSTVVFLLVAAFVWKQLASTATGEDMIVSIEDVGIEL